MRDDLNRDVPEALELAQPLVLDFFVLGQQQILQLAVNVSVLRLSRFLVR